MRAKALFYLWLTTLSAPGFAEWVGGADLFHLNAKDGDFETSTQGLSLSIGRKFSVFKKLYVVPEFRAGKGFGSETVEIVGTDLEVQLERLLSFSTRTYLSLTSKLHLFAMPSYANTEFKVETTILSQKNSKTDDDWHPGLGLGANYKLTQKVWADVLFEYYEGRTIFSLGARITL